MGTFDSWTASSVADWLHSLNVPAPIVSNFVDNDITGELLLHAGHELLKELMVVSLGHRIVILKSIYNLKVSQGLAFEADDYIPESEVSQHGTKQRTPQSSGSKMSTDEFAKLEKMIQDRDQIILRLNNELSRVTADFSKLKDDLEPVWVLVKEYKDNSRKKAAKKGSGSSRNSSKPSPSSATSSSSTIHSPILKSPKAGSSIPPSPSSSMNSINSSSRPMNKAGSSSRSGLSSSKMSSPVDYVDSSSAGDNNIGAIRIYGDKLLNRENESYKSFRVTLDETCASILPNVLKKYKIEDDWRNYALFIMHKGQERCLNFDERPLQYYNQLKEFDSETSFFLKHIKHHTPTSRGENASASSESSTPTSKNPDVSSSSSSLPRSGSAMLKQPFSVSNSNSSLHKDHAMNAVAIYEYKANREDELDIVIGDRVLIINREMGWCIVEKGGKRGWVPTGCLHVDESDSSSQDGAGGDSGSGGNGTSHGHRTTQGYVLYDYEKISPNELSIKKGAVLTIYKKYEHWLLAGWNNKKEGRDSTRNSIAREMSDTRRVADALVREYLASSDAYKPVLSAFREATASHDEYAIHSRSVLAKKLGMYQSYKSNKSAAKPEKSVLELLVKSAVENRRKEKANARVPSPTRDADSAYVSSPPSLFGPSFDKKLEENADKSTGARENTPSTRKETGQVTILDDFDPEEEHLLEEDTSFGFGEILSLSSFRTSTGSRSITLDEALSLRQIVFGKPRAQSRLPSFPEDWKHKGFYCSKHIGYGLVQTKGGPCGLLAVAQAHLIKRLVFSGDFECIKKGKLRPSNEQTVFALIDSLAEMIWRAASGGAAFLAVYNPRRQGFSCHSAKGYTKDGLTECMTIQECASYAILRNAILENIASFNSDSGHGLIQLLYSSILSRGTQRIITEDFDDSFDSDQGCGSFIGMHGYCTQELVNLLMIGRATANVFDGARTLDDKQLHGVDGPSDFGYMTLFEHFKSVQVGTYYKSPRYPVYVVNSESHFTTLFAVSSITHLREFDLFYYDGLANQDEEIFLSLTLTDDPASLFDDDPPLELCVKTHFPTCDIIWTGSDPLL